MVRITTRLLQPRFKNNRMCGTFSARCAFTLMDTSRSGVGCVSSGTAYAARPCHGARAQANFKSNNLGHNKVNNKKTDDREVSLTLSLSPSIQKIHLHVVTMNQSSAARPMMDLTIDNITENVHAINSRCPDRRVKYIIERLVVHLHDLARETRLSTAEWMTALEFLTEVGQTCTSVRQVSFISPSHI